MVNQKMGTRAFLPPVYHADYPKVWQLGFPPDAGRHGVKGSHGRQTTTCSSLPCILVTGINLNYSMGSLPSQLFF